MLEPKIMNVYYGTDLLPYKDKERSVHYPITSGSVFTGASNSTEIRLYVDQIGDLDLTWVANAKLPNGKTGSKVLTGGTDENGTYVSLFLDSWYTQVIGDLYIGLQGYQGGINMSYDEETELWTIYGTPTIQATGILKIHIAYSTPFNGNSELNDITLQQLFALISTKLSIRGKSVYVTELPEVGESDRFYVIKNDPNDTNLVNIYVWDSINEDYVWVGNNTLDLGEYYTKQESQEFESDIQGQIDEFQTTVNERVTSVENEIENVASGSPAGTYATLSDLENAYPTGDSHIYVVESNGHWYFWNGSSWSDGGLYLSADGEDNFDYSSTYFLTNRAISNYDNMFLENILLCKKIISLSNITLTNGYYLGSTGTVSNTSTYWSITNFIDISSFVGQYIYIPRPKQQTSSAVLVYSCLYDENQAFIRSIKSFEQTANYQLTDFIKIFVPSGVKYLRCTIVDASKNYFGIYLENPNMQMENLGNVIRKGNELRHIEGSILASDGSEVTSGSWSRSEFIDISEYAGEFISITTPMGTSSVSTSGSAFYTYAKNYISGVVGESYLQYPSYLISFDKIVKVPTNARFLRVSIQKEMFDKIKIVGFHKQNHKKSNLLLDERYATPLTIYSGIDYQRVFYKRIDIDDVEIKVIANITNSNSIAFLGSVDLKGGQVASHVEFDFGNKTIKFYQGTTGLVLPTTIIKTSSFSTITTTNKYILKVGRKDRELFASVSNYYTGETIYSVVDSQTYGNNHPAGWLADVPKVGLVSGSMTIDSFQVIIPKNIDTIYLGDSITEGLGVPYSDSWCYKAQQYFGKSLGCGRTGGRLEQETLPELETLISFIKPKYVVVTIGTNGGNTILLLKELVSYIKANGSIPIVNCVSRFSNSSSVNSEILSLNEITVRFDIATSVDNDLSKPQNTSLFQEDLTHPNIAGHEAMYQRFLLDIGDLK